MRILMIGLFFLSGCGVSDQIAEAQKRRDDWQKSCISSGGLIVVNYKGRPSNLCFGPDGRLVSSY